MCVFKFLLFFRLHPFDSIFCSEIKQEKLYNVIITKAYKKNTPTHIHKHYNQDEKHGQNRTTFVMHIFLQKLKNKQKKKLIFNC